MTTGRIADSGIVGREDELAAVASSVAGAAAGRAWVVWIEGEAGSGKTALLRAALDALPDGFTVLRAEADELAADIPFNVVQQLGVAATSAFPAGLELIEIWGRAQDGGPVAVAIEDLHWADSGSRLALLAAVRRLGHDRLIVLVTIRPGSLTADGWERFSFDADRCLRVTPGPLSAQEVTLMARHAGVRLPLAAAERLCHHTGGHPLYVRTLLSELTPEQLTADGQLPAPRSLAMTTVTRLAELPPDARALAAALAVVNQRTPLPVAAELAGIGRPARALDDLLSTGFVACESSGQLLSLEYAHPLYRAAVYADLAPSRRQELHRRAADLAGGETALTHRVAAADSADDALADQADAVGRAETARQRLTLAARYLLWASELSSKPEAAQDRLLRAARLLLADEQTTAVEKLRPRIEACAPSSLRSLVLGGLARAQRDTTAAERLLAEAAGLANPAGPAGITDPGDADRDATVDTEVQADALARLAVLYINTIRVREGLDTAERALALRPGQPEVERAALFASAFGAALSHGAQAGLGRLAKRLPECADDVAVADVNLLITRGSLEFWAGRLTAAVSDLRAALRLARHGPALLLPAAHLRLSQLLFETGEWDEALVHAHIAQSLAPDRASSLADAEIYVVVACVLAARGDWAGADEQMAMAQASAADAESTGENEAMFRVGRAACARARGDPAGVISAMGPMAGLADVDTPELARLRQARRLGLGVTWWPTLIEALLDAGDTETAASQLGELRAVVAERHLAFSFRLLALQGRLSAATGRPDLALAEFGEAARAVGPDDPLLDRALLHHAYGRLLHARGDHRGAVDQLREAHKLLAGVGAAPFLARVEADLAAAGMPAAAPRQRGSPLALTGREGDVVALVARGMTNTEVAAELYVSTNTVEYHLRNVFAKLGIKSRRELRQFAAEPPGGSR
jgi:DNA-binding CsgD family transcriptional regulator